MAKSAKANSALVSKIIGRSSLKFIDTLDESVVFNNKDTIRTPVPALNIALGGDLFTGFQSGLSILAGPSKHYKSMLGLRIVSAFLKKYEDAACLFIDSEFGITPAYLKANGVDPTRVVHAPVEHIEQMKFEAVNQLNELAREDKLIIFVDSLGNCPSKKELNDALEEKEKVDMSRAKSIKSLFRMVTPLLNIKDVPMIVINHVYEEQGLFPKMIMSGGCLAEGTRIIMADGSPKAIELVTVGEYVSTLDGPKEVVAAWNPYTLFDGTPITYEIEFEDGHKVICSDEHEFLTTDNTWVAAKDLTGQENLRVSI